MKEKLLKPELLIVVPILVVVLTGSSFYYIFSDKEVKDKKEEYKSGDINNDGKVDNSDIDSLTDYLTDEKNSDEIKRVSDVNGDGKVDTSDLIHLSRVLDNKEGYEIGKEVTLEKEEVKNQTNIKMYGDINLDGIIDSKDVDTLSNYLVNNIKLSEVAKYNADVNNDGLLNPKDITHLLRYLSNWEGYELGKESPSNTNVVEKSDSKQNDTAEVKLKGDANCDGKVDKADSDYILGYLANNNQLSEIGKYNADVNNDGLLNPKDSTHLLRYLENWEGYELGKPAPVPAVPTKPTPVDPKPKPDVSVPKVEVKLKGDANCDGKVDKADSDYILGYLANNNQLSEVGKYNADVNNDGLINPKDSTHLLRYLEKWGGYELGKPAPKVEVKLKGDANCDGKVNNADSEHILNYLTSKIELSEVGKYNADLDSDGEITPKDNTLLIRKLAE